jgi:serine/threonine protein phosphatase PrpC
VPRELKKSNLSTASADEAKQIIRQAVVKANEEIITMGQLDRDLKNMGTTIVMAVWRKGTELFLAGVGDSRGYRVRDNEIEQLTVDHSLAQALVENKTISAAEAREHRFRNVLWKYLGTREVGEGPEVKVLTLTAGDRFLLCSDGLSGVVSDPQLKTFVNEQRDMQQCADGLGKLALDSGSRDNVSCIVIEVAETK